MSRLRTSALVGVILAGSSVGPVVSTVAAAVCDVDGNRAVDLRDIWAIFTAIGRSASGPDDPRDSDGNGAITVTDARKCVARCTLPWCAIVTNTAPVADAGPDQSVLVADTVTLDGSGSSDVNGDPLIYSWSFVSTPAGSAAALSDPSSVRPTFFVDEPGSYIVELVVHDGRSDSAPDTVTVTTSNSAPVADAGVDRTARVGDSVLLDGSGSSDVDGDPLVFSWSLVSAPPGSAASLSNPSAVGPSFDVDAPGTYVIELVVNDGTLDSAPDKVSITTSNSAPVAEAGLDQSAFVRDTVTLDGSGSSDVDGHTLSFSWSLLSLPPGSTASLSDPAAVGPSFEIDLPGIYVAQLIVNDGKVDSAPDTVTVTTENSAPVADAGPNQSAFVGDAVVLDGGGSFDADGDPLTFRWSFTSTALGSASVVSDPEAILPSFDVDAPGIYVVQLIVNDGTVDSAPDTVTITTENSAPLADAGPDQLAFIGDTVALDGSASRDADGDTLSFEWSLTTIPAGSTAALADAAAVMPTFVVDSRGTYVAQLVVNDGALDSAPDTATITIANSAPLADAGSDQQVFVGDTVTLDGSASSDADGDTLSFEWSLTMIPPGSTATLSDPSAILPTFVVDLAGTYEAELVVNDGRVDSASDSVLITAGRPGPVEGVLLPGDPGSPAREAIITFILPGGVPLAEFSLDAAGVEVARTEFEIAFTTDATVGGVNGLLESMGGRIVSMLEGVLIVVVRVPDPGSLDALDTIIATVESSSIVRLVRKSQVPAPDELPSNHVAGSADLDMIDHHLSVGAAAAWNARAAVDAPGAQRPLTVVADFFGDGPPNADVDVVFATNFQFGFGQPNSHGYHVLGILSADYGGDTSDRGLATGMFPDTLEVGIADFVVDATHRLTIPRAENEILAFVQSAPGNVIVSTSFGFFCRDAATVAANCNLTEAALEALRWIEKVRGSGLENRFLHVTSAGNVNVPGDTDARFNSPAAAARLLRGLQVPGPSGPQPVPNLTNTLVVENAANLPLEPFSPMCLNVGSKRAGDLAGIGTLVHSLTGATAGTGDESGTSMSTPQVAGLAAYVWSLDPSLTAQQVMGILLSRASPGVGVAPGQPVCDVVTSSPVIDAYAAILAVDRPSAFTGSGPPSDAPARLAILDAADGTGQPADADGTPAGNGEFDELDVELFQQSFAATSGGLDFSRYDLNGDGRTGTAVRKGFDLDNSGSQGVLAQQIDGTDVSFDESGLTDMEILCYYAYSSLFTGDPTVRDGQIGTDCTPPITIKQDGTRFFWQIYDADENLLCCNDLFLSQDSAPPVSMSLGHGSFVVHRPSPQTLAIDVTATSFDDPTTDASSAGTIFLRAEVVFDDAGILVVDIDPGWFGTGQLEVLVTILETGELVFCGGSNANFSCSPGGSLSSLVTGPGTRTLDVTIGIGGGGADSSAASGRAVTISRR